MPSLEKTWKSKGRDYPDPSNLVRNQRYLDTNTLAYRPQASSGQSSRSFRHNSDFTSHRHRFLPGRSLDHWEESECRDQACYSDSGQEGQASRSHGQYLSRDYSLPSLEMTWKGKGWDYTDPSILTRNQRHLDTNTSADKAQTTSGQSSRSSRHNSDYTSHRHSSLPGRSLDHWEESECLDQAHFSDPGRKGQASRSHRSHYSTRDKYSTCKCATHIMAAYPTLEFRRNYFFHRTKLDFPTDWDTEIGDSLEDTSETHIDADPLQITASIPPNPFLSPQTTPILPW